MTKINSAEEQEKRFEKLKEPLVKLKDVFYLGTKNVHYLKVYKENSENKLEELIKVRSTKYIFLQDNKLRELAGKLVALRVFTKQKEAYEYIIRATVKLKSLLDDWIEVENKAREEIKEKSSVPNKLSSNKDLQISVLEFLAKRQRREATEVIATELLNKEHIYTTRHDEKPGIWIYKEGIYISQGKTYIKEFCREIFGEAYTTALGDEVIAKIEAETFIEQKEFFIVGDIYKLPVQNGVLDLRTKKLFAFSPKYRFFNKLSVEYNPDKKCSAIFSFFDSLFDNKDDIKVIQEIFGYLLFRDYKIEKAFMFIGNGRNGKGKTIELMKRFLGVENCANLSLQDLDNDNFSLGELHNKMVNLGADISPTALKNTGKFKSLTGHDLLSAARKFLTRIHFVNYAKLIFCTNELPITYDKTLAFFDRWILIDFKYTFLSQREINKLSDSERKNVKLADKEIINKISIPDELSGLLNWALDGLDRLLKNGDFSYSQSNKEVKDTWLRKSDSVSAFIMDCVEEKENSISKADFRKIYATYCKKYKLKLSDNKHIKETLETTLGVSDQYIKIFHDDKQRWCWNGIKVREDKIEELEVKNITQVGKETEDDSEDCGVNEDDLSKY